jgi:tungstate transport system permease protein
MDDSGILDALRTAWRLIVTLNPDVFEYAQRSLAIAATSTAIAGLIGVPLGVLVAENDFRGKRVVVTLLNTLLALPTVVVGLTVYLFLRRNGPLGSLDLLLTVPGIVIGEVLLIIPVVAALTLAV